MKMRFISAICLTAAGVILLASSSLALAQSNDVEHGMQVFKQCAPCHATTNKTRASDPDLPASSAGTPDRCRAFVTVTR